MFDCKIYNHLQLWECQPQLSTTVRLKRSRWRSPSFWQVRVAFAQREAGDSNVSLAESAQIPNPSAPVDGHRKSAFQGGFFLKHLFGIVAQLVAIA